MPIDFGAVNNALRQNTEDVLARRDAIANLILKANQAASLDESRKSAAEARLSSAEARKATSAEVRQRTADRLLNQLEPGAVLDPATAAKLREADLGSLIEEQAAPQAVPQVAPVAAQPDVQNDGSEGSLEFGGVPAPVQAAPPAAPTSAGPPRLVYKGNAKQIKDKQRTDLINQYLDEEDPEKRKKLATRLQVEHGVKQVQMNDGSAHLYRVGAEGVEDMGPIPGLTAPRVVQQSASVAPLDFGNGIDLAAWQLIQTGQAPYMGSGAAGAAAKAAVYKRAGELAPSDTNLATAQSDFKANATSQTGLQKMRDAVGAFEETALRNADVMKKIGEGLRNTGSPFLNRPVRELLTKGAGDPQVAAYRASVQTVQLEFAKILGNPNLTGVLTNEARQEMQEVINGDMTPEQITAVVDVLATDAQNRAASLDDMIGKVRGRINPRGVTNSPAGAAGGETPTATGIAVKAPNGKTYLFQTKEAADAFRSKLSGGQ